MANPKSYKTATALRTALGGRLSREGKERKLEVQQLSRQVAFDRLLARIFSETDPPFLLKGGYVMHLRVKKARLYGRSFEKFLLDVGVGDVWIEPLTTLKGQG